MLEHTATTSFSWGRWDVQHPEVLTGLLLLEGLYLACVGPMRRYFTNVETAKPTRGQVAAFSSGVFVFFLADTGPIHELSEGFLFSAHMTQHILMTLVAPPLLLLGTPAWLLRPLFQPRLLERVGRFLTHPIVAFVAFNVVFAVWHLPALYDAPLRSTPVHGAEHASFILTALMMWWPIVGPLPELPRPSYLVQMAYVFLLPIAQLIVFAPITFSGAILYPFYSDAPRLWGLSPLADQQMGGVIMKLASTVIFIATLALVFSRWFKHEMGGKPARPY